MQGNPSVSVFRHAGRDQIYAFVRGDNDDLRVCFWNATPGITSWQWDNRGAPAGAGVRSTPATTKSIQNDWAREHFLRAFVSGGGRLFEHFWNGSQWVGWVDHNQPHLTVRLNTSPAVLPFRLVLPTASPSADSLILFAWGGEDQLYRYVHSVSGTASRVWHLQGTPPAPPPQPRPVVGSEPAAIRGPGVRHEALYAYVVGSDGHLYANFSTDGRGQAWSWQDLGQPDQNTEAVLFHKPSLARFRHDGEDRIYAFVRGSDGHLWNHFWRGPRWQDQGTWGDLGPPPGAPGTTVAFGQPTAAITFRFVEPQRTTDRIYVFLRGSNDHLFVRYWDGVRWNWEDFGRPTTDGHDIVAHPQGGTAAVTDAPGAVTFTYVEPHRTTDRIYAFVRGGDNHLHTCYWNGIDLWLWNDLGTP
jgi:hypothetical protein